MPVITLHTRINAPVQRCFDLSRSIDLHKASTSRTREEAIAGVTNGLINEGETVTWRARHFGMTQTMTTIIADVRPPHFFISRMHNGPFKRIEHRHIFRDDGEGTLMIDEFEFEAPCGIFGKIFSWLVLTGYMKKFLVERNDSIKRIAESGEWKNYL
jgi:ligand-binding SRPBCC domain-containing protein